MNLKGSERIRNKRLRASTCLSAVTAALRDEESDVEMEPEEQDDEVFFLYLSLFSFIIFFSLYRIQLIPKILNGNYLKRSNQLQIIVQEFC